VTLYSVTFINVMMYVGVVIRLCNVWEKDCYRKGITRHSHTSCLYKAVVTSYLLNISNQIILGVAQCISEDKKLRFS